MKLCTGKFYLHHRMPFCSATLNKAVKALPYKFSISNISVDCQGIVLFSLLSGGMIRDVSFSANDVVVAEIALRYRQKNGGKWCILRGAIFTGWTEKKTRGMG